MILLGLAAPSWPKVHFLGFHYHLSNRPNLLLIRKVATATDSMCFWDLVPLINQNPAIWMMLKLMACHLRLGALGSRKGDISIIGFTLLDTWMLVARNILAYHFRITMINPCQCCSLWIATSPGPAFRSSWTQQFSYVVQLCSPATRTPDTVAMVHVTAVGHPLRWVKSRRSFNSVAILKLLGYIEMSFW